MYEFTHYVSREMAQGYNIHSVTVALTDMGSPF